MNPEFEPTLTQQPKVVPPPPPTQRSRRLPSLFWPGFVAGFMLLSVLSCGGLAVATGLNRIDLEDIQGNGVVWTPPAVQPTATPDLSAPTPASVPEGAFSLGAMARNITNSRVNIRQTPGHLGKTPDDIVGQVEPGATLQIIAGPAPMDNLTWWLIRYNAPDGRSIEGWVAEATQSGVQILGQ
jgi:hypothetical protein